MLGDDEVKYCSECKKLYSEEAEACANCGDALAEVKDDDKVFLITASVIQRERIKIILEDNSIELFEEANGRKKDLYVNYSDFDKAVDILLKVDALPSDFKDENKKAKKKTVKTAAEIRALEKKEAERQAQEENGEAADAHGDDGSDKKPTVKAGENESRFSKLLSEDDDKSIYELFGFQKLSRKKRIITAAVLWIVFGIVIFLLIAGVDMIMEFVRGLFS